MKIGIIGTRGIPNAYGGFEQFAQYLAKGLADKGHSVIVYNSSDHPYKENKWEQVDIVHCKDWEARIGTAGQFIYDYNCILDARKRDFDILLHLGYTSNSIWYPLWPRQSINIVNMDGLEWKRSKYNKMTQSFLKRAETWAARHATSLIADSIGIQQYLLDKYNIQSTYIPYGAEIPAGYDETAIASYQLKPNEYCMLIARMEPENNIETIIKGYLQSNQPYPLVVVGNTGNKFGQHLTQTYNQPSIRFAGAIYNSNIINNLRYYSHLYFHGHSVGGTNPSLLEAMACSCNIAAHNNAFNKAILNEDAWYFSTPEEIRDIINNPVDQAEVLLKKKHNLDKIYTKFNWPEIIEEYEQTFLRIMNEKTDR